MAPALVGLLLNDELGRGDGVGHAQGLGVAQAHAVLRAAGGMEGVLHGHGHLLEREDRVTTQVASGIAHRKIEVANVVERLGRVLVGEVVILQLGTNVEQVAGLLGLMEHATQRSARVAGEGLAIGSAHVAEHTGDAVVARTPRQNLEGRGIRERQHVGFLGRGKASMAEPSKPMPSSNATSRSSGLMAKFLRRPRMSTNHRRTKRMSRCSTERST